MEQPVFQPLLCVSEATKRGVLVSTYRDRRRPCWGKAGHSWQPPQGPSP